MCALKTRSGFHVEWKWRCPVWRAVRQAVAVKGQAITAGMLCLFCPLYQKIPVRRVTSRATRHMNTSSLVWPRVTGPGSVHNTTSHIIAQTNVAILTTLFSFKVSSCGIHCGRSGTERGLSQKNSVFHYLYYIADPPFSVTYLAIDGQWALCRPQFRTDITPLHSISIKNACNPP